MKKFRKFLSGVVATATLLMCSFGMTVHADGLLDEVYTNYYYKYILETGEIKPYCLSSDSSLDGYIQTYSNSNSRSGSLMTTNPIIDTPLTPEIISQSYVDLTDKEISSVRSAYSTRSTVSNSISEMTDYDKTIVRILSYYTSDSNPNIAVIEYGTGFIIQDWGGKSCVVTAGHVVSGEFENEAVGELRELPDYVDIQICDSRNHELAKYRADAIHLSKERIDYNPLVHNEFYHDYALITVPIGGENNYPSLADTYGRLFIGTIDIETSANVELRGIYSANNEFYQAHSFGRFLPTSERVNLDDSYDSWYNKLLFSTVESLGSLSGSPMIVTDGTNEIAVGSHIGRWSLSSFDYAVSSYFKWSVTRFLAFNPCV